MRRDDAENIPVWAARPEVWDQESQQVKKKYGAAVDKARKALAKAEEKPEPAMSKQMSKRKKKDSKKED